jgi:DNA-binding PadR family transcriptional regulator
MIVSREGEPVPKRGGRSKVFYEITPAGKRELVKIQKMYEFLWDGSPSLAV